MDSAVTGEVTPTGYKFLDHPRPVRTGGGTCVLFKESITGKQFMTLLNILGLFRMRLIVVYRPPYSLIKLLQIPFLLNFLNTLSQSSSVLTLSSFLAILIFALKFPVIAMGKRFCRFSSLWACSSRLHNLLTWAVILLTWSLRVNFIIWWDLTHIRDHFLSNHSAILYTIKFPKPQL